MGYIPQLLPMSCQTLNLYRDDACDDGKLDSMDSQGVLGLMCYDGGGDAYKCDDDENDSYYTVL